MEAYTDADYPRSILDRRSISGYYAFLGGNLVTWQNKKKTMVVKSSVEVEFRATAREFVNYYGLTLF